MRCIVASLLVSLPLFADGFLQPQLKSTPPKLAFAVEASLRSQRTTFCLMSPSDEDDDGDDGNDDDDEDDDIDPNSLGDWRAFRMNLANSDGLSSSSVEGILEETETSTASASYDSSTASNRPKSRPKSVSKQNEQLLNAQNAALADEYLNGAWAHESAVAEVGGLVCRMPLEAEIYRGNPDSSMYNKLRAFLESDEYDRTEDSIPTSLKSSASTGGAASVSVSTKGIIERLAEDSAPSNGSDDDSTFSALAAKTVFWYRGAEKLLKRELLKITSEADTNGRIDPKDLDATSMELLQLYMENQQTWQEVCLVIEKDERTGSAKTLTINRPMAFKLSKSLGRLVLLGAMQSEKGVAVNRREANGKETQNVVKFLAAFENQCGVYVGGPDGMDQPAMMVHGIANLPGAEEISPGTGIYRGGLEAACDGVLEGRFKPLDFRFFVGHTNYAGGELDKAVGLGKYQPVACSRPLVLKQCIQLPKPLWHEGMLCYLNNQCSYFH